MKVEKVIVLDAERVVMSDTAPEEISIPFIVSSVSVEIAPVAATWNISAVPEVKVPDTSKFPVMPVLSLIAISPSISEISPVVDTLIPVVALPISTVSLSMRFESESEIVPVRIKVPAIVVLSDRAIVSAPAFMVILPVVVPPMVKV